MRFEKDLWKWTPLSLLLLLWALPVMCTAQAYAQVDTANWFGGFGNWNNPEAWSCSGSIADMDDDCVPNGRNVAVSIANGGGVILNANTSTFELFIDGDLEGSNFVVAYITDNQCHGFFAANRERETAILLDSMQLGGPPSLETLNSTLKVSR